MKKAEDYFSKHSRKIMDFSDTNEEVISEEDFIEYVSSQSNSEAVEILKYVLKTHHIVDTFTGRKFQVIGTNSNYYAKDIYKIFLSNNK